MSQLNIRWRFFVGLPRNEDGHCETSLGAEQRRFGDIVILPIVDTYENLTQKVMGMITYTARCSDGEFYAKCDDDVFVYAWRLKREWSIARWREVKHHAPNPQCPYARMSRFFSLPRLVSRLVFLSFAERLLELKNDTSLAEYAMGVYMGNFWIDAKPIREEWHKNHEGRWTGSYFPPYAGGPFYVLSRPAAEYVLTNSKRLNWKWRNEDMAVGTWMTGVDVKIVQEWKIKLLNWKHHERPYIAEHAIVSSDGRGGIGREGGRGRRPHDALPSEVLTPRFAVHFLLLQDPEGGVEHWHAMQHGNFSIDGV